jgi:branched-chain amino acid transport system ATP-binding protein
MLRRPVFSGVGASPLDMTQNTRVRYESKIKLCCGVGGSMLETVGVSKRFGGMTAVDDVSFKVERGGIVGLIGPNGAGKTTMFNLIAGALRPSGGRILLDGRAVERRPAEARIGLGLGRTFQIPRPFADMTVLENLLLSAQAQAGERIMPNWFRSGAVARQERALLAKARELLDFLALSAMINEPARILSGGQRKLLELARVMMAEPEIILLDEPAAGVNPALLETIIARIGEINSRGVTFLIIEHNMDVVARLCRKVVVMAGGRLLCEGTAAEVASDGRVIDAYLGGAAA